MEQQRPLTVRPGNALKGVAKVPGDKSISHRAIILGAMSVGETRISGLLEGDDVLATARAAELFGAEVNRIAGGEWSIHGLGTGGFFEPLDVIDCGNSGTGARLLIGTISTMNLAATFTGDHSLRSRPMRRIVEPLARFGAQFHGRSGNYLPMTIRGASEPVPVRYDLPVASAQVKSAVLLAGLNAPGQTIVLERWPTRDHTERMLESFGASIKADRRNGGSEIILDGYPELTAQAITVPRDPSSAAFPLAAALITPGSEVRVNGVGVNPTRIGLFDTLREMGADLEFVNSRIVGGEPVADITARHSGLSGVEVPPERAVTMIDEYPILSVLAAFAEGKTLMRGIKELRVKETDRIDAMAKGLRSCGAEVEEQADQMAVHGQGPEGVIGGATCESKMDHRIAMSFICLGLAARSPVSVDDTSSISTSFPGFSELMAGLGAEFQQCGS